MKKLFTMIRRGDLEEVARILDKKPALIACTATAPPKKDHGQSPLMVAIKAGRPEAANLLLDYKADVNFKEQPNPYDPYGQSAPIWLDALCQCVHSARQVVTADGNIITEEKERQSIQRAETWFALLRRMLELGLDPNQKAEKSHYYAGAPRNAWVGVLDEYDYFARENLSGWSYALYSEDNRRLREMCRAIFDLLLKHGVDIHDIPEGEQDTRALLLRNISEGRELLEGFPDLEPREPYPVTYRGKTTMVTPLSPEENRKRYETKWGEMADILRPYYQKG
ncbi:MAG: ankyrin repeat domain-containing protein [Angelakisella sp.]|jgi:hypothetical protein|nr:ankyrin repeat domain-containing protein [Angelakisella sp.]